MQGQCVLFNVKQVKRTCNFVVYRSFLYTPVSTHTHTLSLSHSLPFAPHAPHTIILYNRFVSNTQTTFARQHSYTNTNTNTREQRSMLLDLVQCHCVAEHALHITSRHNASRSIESESVRHMCPLLLSLVCPWNISVPTGSLTSVVAAAGVVFAFALQLSSVVRKQLSRLVG